MKVSKENFGWIFSCVALAVGLIISIILGFTGMYCQNASTFLNDLKLGDNLQLEMRENQANSMSVNIDGSYLPNEKLKQDLFVKNFELEKDIFLRAKVYIFSTESKIINVGIDLAPNWKYNLQDGYYYYNGALAPQNKTILASNIIIDESAQLFSSKKYILTVLAESLSDKNQAENLWKIDFSSFFNEE